MKITEERDVSLNAPRFVTEKQARFSPERRLWQSAPGAAMTENGRIFCVYSADNDHAGETSDNYTVCAYSDDGGTSFKLAFYAYHEHDVRMSEALLFLAPDGKLYHFWTQSYRYFDGRGGVWCAVCDEPDAGAPVFSSVRRVCDGFMADVPVILSDGRWLFPATVWTHMDAPFHPLPQMEKVTLLQTDSRMEAFRVLGGVDSYDPDFTENTVYECGDGRLVMLFRTDHGIGRAESTDGGETWSDPRPFVLPGPGSRFFVTRFPSGALLVVTHHRFIGRNNLTALLSDDDGETFPYSLLLDGRDQVSYPSGNVTKEGRAVIAYDRERVGAREILLASFTEEDLRRGEFGEGSFTAKVVSKGGEKEGV